MEKLDSVFINPNDIKTDRNIKQHRSLTKTAKLLITLAILCVVASVVLLFATTKVQSIQVINNEFLSQDYIKEIASVKEGDLYFFLKASSKEAKAKKSALISDISIKAGNHKSVVIDVKENRIIGYQITTDEYGANTTEFILSDGNIINFDSSCLKNLALIPYFIDINEQQRETICKVFSSLDVDILSRVSEVSGVSFTFDSNVLKLVMNDGYTVYSSLNGLGYLKDYLKIIVNDTKNSGKCMLILEEYNSAVLMKCSEINSYMANTTEQ